MFPDESSVVNTKENKYFWSVVGTLQCYVRVIDSALLLTLSSIVTQHIKLTQKIMEKIWRLLKYVDTFPNIKLRYDVEHDPSH